MVSSIAITRVGYEKLVEDLRELLSQRRMISEEISAARSKGDLSENAEYHAALEKQSHLERKISEFDSIISNAEIINPADIDSDIVVFGATVFIVDMDGNKRKYQIVSAYEADVSHGTISAASPIAMAMMDKKVGDIFELQTPRGEITYKILDIKYE